MDRETAKQVAKDQLGNYLTGKGINIRKPFRCINPEHSDSKPSMSYKNNHAHCFSCGAHYDIFDIVGLDYGLSEDKDTFNKVYELLGIEIDTALPAATTRKPKELSKIQNQPKTEQKSQEYTDYFLKAYEQIGNTQYLQHRGLSQETIDKYKLGYEPNFTQGTGGKSWQAIIIPTTKYTYTVRNIAKDVDKKDRIRKVGSNVLFNVAALSGSSPVFIVEGELDALSIIEAGGSSTALGSTANYHKLTKYLKERDIRTPLIVIALDNDEDGKKTASNIIEELGDYDKAAVIVQDDIYGSYKDANEMLIHDKPGLKAAIVEAQCIVDQEQEKIAEEYKKNNVAGYIKDFMDGIKASVNTPFIPTGYERLDKILDGGLYEGLYIVGAISSLGKTTYIMQLADQIAQTGIDVLIFSLEMARTEIMSKSISRLTLLDCLVKNKTTAFAKTARGITTGKRYNDYSKEETDLIHRSIKNYSYYADHIYITEGVGDIGVEQIKDAVKTHISITGNKPIVIIDYLQILAPVDPRASDKQNADRAVLDLKRMSRDYKIPVIGISSLNRQNYNEPVNMAAFKESGAIEYGSDVLIGMQLLGAGTKNFDVNKAKRQNPRAVEVIVLKNRNGAAGDKVSYDYHTMFNYFQETDNREYISEENEENFLPVDDNGFRELIGGKTPFDK